METTHELNALRSTKFGTMKYYRHTYNFYVNVIFFVGPFVNGDGKIFRLLRWMQTLHQSSWDNEILYKYTSLKDNNL
jgi:hypothetical protein